VRARAAGFGRGGAECRRGGLGGPRWSRWACWLVLGMLGAGKWMDFLLVPGFGDLQRERERESRGYGLFGKGRRKKKLTSWRRWKYSGSFFSKSSA
jgi:hypothetical protein